MNRYFNIITSVFFRYRMLAVATLLLSAICLPVASHASTYYLDNRPGSGGSNSNAGTSPGSPWRDFDSINSRVFGPSDRILLARGASWHQQMTLNGSGAPDRWILVGAYGQGARPRLIGSDDANERMIRMNDPSYWNVSDLEISNAGVGLLVFFKSLGHEGLVFNNLYLHDIRGIWAAHAYRAPNYKEIDADRTKVAEKDKVFMSAGIVITAAPLRFTDTDYAARNILIANTEGTHNLESIAISPFGGLNSTTSDGTSFFQNIVMDHLDLHDDDGPGAGTSDSLRLVNVSHARLTNSILDREAGFHTPSGTAAIFLGQINDITIANNVLTRVPDTQSGDQTAIDFEAATRAVRMYGNYIAYNAGPGIEFLNIHGGRLDHCDNHQVCSNAFVANGQNAHGNQIGAGSLYQTGNVTPSTGIIRDNLYSEIDRPFLKGDFSHFSQSNNLNLSRPPANSMHNFAGRQGSNGWSYQYRSKSTEWQNLPDYNSNLKFWSLQRGGSQEPEIGRFDISPGASAGSAVARVWTARSAGRISIRGNLLAPEAGDGENLSISITRNGTLLWGPKVINQVYDQTGVETKLDNISVGSGDIIRFEVSNPTDHNPHKMSWAVTIGYTH